MYKDYNVVVVTPAGRRKYLDIFKRFIYRKMEEGLVDHWQLWQNTVDDQDKDYLASMEAENPKVKRYFLADERIIPSYDTYDALRTHEFFLNCHDDNTIYIRFDDDIIWAADDALEKMIQARIDNPDAFLIYPNIINSTIVTSWHQKHGVLDHSKGSVRQQDGHGDPDHAYLDVFNYSDSNLIDHIHETFKINYLNNTLSNYYLESKVLSNYQRFSICSICWWGKDKVTPGRIEEPQLAWELPALFNRPVFFCGDALMVHYSYHTQRKHLEAQGDKPLAFYNEIVK
jgi:hypothetical protein